MHSGAPATWGPLLPRIPQVLRHGSRALPTTLEAEFVATAGMLGPQIRWSSSVLESPLVIPGCCAHSLP